MTTATIPYTALSWDERQQVNRSINDSLDGLHTALGDGWIVSRHSQDAWWGGWELTGPDGERLHIRADDGRIAVVPDHPAGVEYWSCKRDETPRKITVSPSKTHAQIARDIERRILGEYRRLMPATYAAQRERDDARRARADVVDDLYRVLSPLGEVRDYSSRRGSDVTALTVGDSYDGPGSVTVKDMSATRTHFPDTVEVRVPRAKLVEVCAAVAAILTA